jgi:hypothetical protein
VNDHAGEEPKTETVDKQEDSSEKQPPKQAAKKKAKPSTKRRDSQKGNKAKAPKGGARSPRPFPADTLENAIKIAKAIKEFNGGNPWPPSEVANALGLGTSSSAFYYLSASARDYGLTIGTRDTEQIELNTIGRELVYATSAEMEREALRKAFFNVELFKSVYNYYKGSSLPELKFLQNTLESVFKIQPKYHEEFFNVYTENCRFLDIQGIDQQLSESNRQEKQSPSPHSIVVGEPSSKTSLVAFVAMPFAEKTDGYVKGFFNEVLKNLITPAAIEAGFRVETARREGSDVIHSTIVNDLLNADLVIADLTEHNPNVLFELGLRMASEKPIALIKAKGTLPIFDVDNLLRVLDYDSNLWRSTLEVDIPRLTSHIQGSWESKDTLMSYMQILKKHA